MRSLGTLAAVAALAALTVLPADAVSPGQPGKIAFTSNRDAPAGDLRGNFDIYTVNSGGGGVQRLTTAQGIDGTPVWSPDGRKVVFRSNKDHYDPDPQRTTYEIYVMNADGTGQKRLTDDGTQDLDPAWSPDGKRIAFASNRDGNFEVYVMNAAGSGLVNLTENSGSDTGPTWSPNGNRIAFASGRFGPADIYAVNADGSSVVQLTSGPDFDVDPTWSPDGKRIAFSSLSGGNLEIHVMNADGSGRTRLTNDPHSDFQPAWAPDGRRILFSSDRDSGAPGLFHLYTMSVDGSNATRLQSGTAADLEGDWQTLPTSAQAIATVRALLAAHAKACRLRIGRIEVKSIAGGFRVTAHLSKGGKSARAVFDVSGASAKPVNRTAKRIQRNCR